MFRKILVIPIIMAVTAGSVAVISKLGGETASKQIRDMFGVDMWSGEDSQESEKNK